MANGSFLLSYATKSAMDADTGQANGTFAQVVNDGTAANNANYQSTGGVWSLVANNLFGVDVPDLFSLGASTTLLSAAIKAGEVHLIAHGYAVADGSTDDAPAINAIGAALESLGGGKIVFDRPPPGGYYTIASPILLRDKVTFEGVDTSVLIRNTSSTTNMRGCFHGCGLSQSNYGYFTVYALNAITAGDRSVTCSVGGSAAHFSVGQVILIFSKDGESPEGTVVHAIAAGGTNFEPFFSRQYRITSIVGEVITLDYAVAEDVANPVICDGTGGQWGSPSIPTKLIDRPVIRNLRMSSDPSHGEPVDGGFYEGLIENIWVESARHLLGGNGYARLEARGLRGFFSVKCFELATGSHDSYVHDVLGAWSGSDIIDSLILAGEYTANIEYADFKLLAADASPAGAAFNISQTSGMVIRDGYVRYNEKGVDLHDRIAMPTSDIEIRNVIMNLTNQAVNFEITPSAGNYAYFPTGIRLRNVRFTGDDPSTAGLRFTQNSSIDFHDVDASNGVIDIATGKAPTGPMSRIQCSGWTGSFDDINQIDKRGFIRSSGQGAYSASQYLINTTSTSTSANHVVATFTLPAGLTVTGRDQIIIEASGSVGTNTAASKTIAFDDGNGVVLSQTVASGDKGAFLFRAVVTFESDTVASTSAILTYSVSPATQATGFLTTTAEVRRTGLTIGASGLTITLQGWIGGAGPTITFNSIRMYSKLYGE